MFILSSLPPLEDHFYVEKFSCPVSVLAFSVFYPLISSNRTMTSYATTYDYFFLYSECIMKSWSVKCLAYQFNSFVSIHTTELTNTNDNGLDFKIRYLKLGSTYSCRAWILKRTPKTENVRRAKKN